MKIAIYGNKYNLSDISYIETLLFILEEKKTDIRIYKPFYDYWKHHLSEKLKPIETFTQPNDIARDTDYMISIGGDGTFLESVVYVRDKGIPIVGINMGRLGFLASIKQEDIPFSMNELCKKNYSVEDRSLIHFTNNEGAFNNFPYALNDVTIQKKDTSMITVHAYLNDELLNSYWSDGLIISTSTGSTAYSLSVGGPIILPSSKNLLISPIAPHNLSVRPVIIPDDYTIKLKIESRSDNYLATVDNRTEVLGINKEIILKSAGFKIKLLHFKNYSFYDTIRGKLMWGIDKRN
jgi:NAD+ kinase